MSSRANLAERETVTADALKLLLMSPNTPLPASVLFPYGLASTAWAKRVLERLVGMGCVERVGRWKFVVRQGAPWPRAKEALGVDAEPEVEDAAPPSEPPATPTTVAEDGNDPLFHALSMIAGRVGQVGATCDEIRAALFSHRESVSSEIGSLHEAHVFNYEALARCVNGLSQNQNNFASHLAVIENDIKDERAFRVDVQSHLLSAIGSMAGHLTRVEEGEPSKAQALISECRASFDKMSDRLEKLSKGRETALAKTIADATKLQAAWADALNRVADVLEKRLNDDKRLDGKPLSLRHSALLALNGTGDKPKAINGEAEAK